MTSPAGTGRQGLAGEATLSIDAPATLIWSMLADVSRMGEWSPESTGGEWIAPATGPAVGARFRGHNRRRSRWTTTVEVTAATPGEEFAFQTVGSKPTLWRYHLEPQDVGTRVTEQFEVPRYTWVDRLAFWLTTGVRDRERDLVTGCQTTLGKLKAAAETAARPTGEHP